MDHSRRTFLKTMLVASFAVPALFSPQALGNDFWNRPRTLRLRRAETGETVYETYWADGRIVQPGYDRICHLMRDVSAGVQCGMDVVLLDILRGMQGWFLSYGQDRVITINSGYRTDATNNRLEGAARNSWHKRGGAADVRIEDVPVDYMAQLAKYLRGGGVGIYQQKRFLHVDRGNIRTWRG